MYGANRKKYLRTFGATYNNYVTIHMKGQVSTVFCLCIALRTFLEYFEQIARTTSEIWHQLFYTWTQHNYNYSLQNGNFCMHYAGGAVFPYTHNYCTKCSIEVQ